MSDIREKLLGPRNIRSQIIKVVVLSIVLVTAFAFSVALINVIFGSLRFTPSYPMTEADFDDRDKTPIPIPYNISDLLDFLQGLGLELDEDMLETLMDMFDGDFDDLPLGDLAELMAALMFSDVDVFRVYNYTSFQGMEDYLWKYECFDTYSGGTWSDSHVDPEAEPFFTYNEYLTNASSNLIPQILMLKMLNLTPNEDSNNRFTVPTLFSSPLVMENSVNATGIDNSSIYLRKQRDGLNGSAILAYFTQGVLTNLTYSLVGEQIHTDSFINSTCVLVDAPVPEGSDYDLLLDHYLEMNGNDMAIFLGNPAHSNINDHYNYLNTNIINSTTDNAFIIADKIRNYLQYNFNLSYVNAPDTRDPIDYFFETQEGLYGDMASAFCALTRAFGVVSRFVDGFNSLDIVEEFDPVEGTNSIAIEYQNLYSWAEVFIPTSNDGSTGYWAQIDTYFQNFMGNPPTPVFGNNSFTIDIETNYTSSLNHVDRGDIINVTATLLNNSLPMANMTITFTDETIDDTLGFADTNGVGEASLLINITDDHVVGPHIISAQYNPQTYNGTYYIINDTISINLTSLININLMSDPQAINVSQANNDTIRVQGYVYDPLNGERVIYTNLNFSLFLNGSSIPIANPFTPSETTADSNGDFIVDLEARSNLFPNFYEVMANSDGTWNYTLTIFSQSIDIQVPMGAAPPSTVQNSSQRLNLTIERDLIKYINFYIDNIPSDNAESPIVGRDQIITLKAIVLNESLAPLAGEIVYFYNYSNGQSYEMGSNSTLANGETTWNLRVGINATVGPNLLYAKLDSFYNYSYYILNDQSNISITQYSPVPFVVNKSNSETFIITGFLFDGNNSKPLANCDVSIRIFDRYGVEYTSNLTVSSTTFSTNSTGGFQRTFGVHSNIPVGNFTVTFEFNGSFNDYATNPYYPYSFNLSSINTSFNLTTQLQITYDAPLYFNFFINGTTSDNFSAPIINRNGDLNLTARLLLGETPMSGYNVSFYDITQNDLYIGSDITNIDGYASYTYNTNASTIAGPHLLYAQYGNAKNYSYFILDAPIEIVLNLCPTPRNINSTGNIGRTFAIQGYLKDATNGANISYGIIEIFLYEGIIDQSNYLIEDGGSQQSLNYFNCNNTGEIYALFNVSSLIPAQNYTLTANFSGSINYDDGNYPYLFNLPFLSNSTICAYQLQVNDPQDISITLKVNGTHAPLSYPSGGLPEVINLGEILIFSGHVNQSGSNATTGNVHLYDVYNNPSTPISSDAVNEGKYEISINTLTENFHSGLHLIKVVYEDGIYFDTYNSTYIIINETFTLTIDQSNSQFQRDTTGFTISGRCQDGARYLRGMNVSISLIDNNGWDVSGYLEMSGSRYIITDVNGLYNFTINRISLNCPYGNFTIRISFNGTIIYSDAPLSINMQNSMVNVSSSILLNVTAGTQLVDCNYWMDYFNDRWYQTDIMHVNLTLQWDNGSYIQGMNLTIEVIGTVLYNRTYAVPTSGTGYIDIPIEVGDWDDTTEIWIYFTPTNPTNFGPSEGYYIASDIQQASNPYYP